MRRLLFFLALSGLTYLWAQNEPCQVKVGARALGMGGAFSAIADDGTAPLWNPAAVAYQRKPRFLQGSFNLLLDPSVAQREFIQHPPFTTDDRIELVQRLGESPVAFDAGVATGFMPGNGLAFTMVACAGGEVTTTTGDPPESRRVQLQGDLQLTAALTYARRVDARTALGVNLKYLTGRTATTTVTQDQTGLELRDTLSELERRVDLDVGILYRLSSDTHLGMVGYNLLQPELASRRLKPFFDVGIAYRLPNGVGRIAWEVSGLGRPPTFFNIGGEFVFGRNLTLRLGIYRQEPVIGFTLFRLLHGAFSLRDDRVLALTLAY